MLLEYITTALKNSILPLTLVVVNVCVQVSYVWAKNLRCLPFISFPTAFTVRVLNLKALVIRVLWSLAMTKNPDRCFAFKAMFSKIYCTVLPDSALVVMHVRIKVSYARPNIWRCSTFTNRALYALLDYIITPMYKSNS